MALLQISEPGQSPEPHRHRLAVGIDLGTTNSLVATVRNGISVVLNDHDGHALLPSIVRYLRDGGVSVGREAEAALARGPRRVWAASSPARSSRSPRTSTTRSARPPRTPASSRA